ncbi:MAG: LCP family protein [Candidatus Saganbacteria bacterium]|nr:LCP family protein [Candidatus Saganbacteria bacterium]
MKKNKIDLVRVSAILVVILSIIYFYLNIFYPSLIPKTFRIGMLRRPINILILGTDTTFDRVTRKPMPNLSGRADSLVLVHVDPIASKINALSIPRDTYVAIPGYRPQKINASNAYGGIDLTQQTVSKLTGQKIDYYVEIKPSAITQVVDLLGGITIYVEKNMRYSDRAQNLDINLKKGLQKLSGKEAHDYIRFRSDYQGDIGRVRRQQNFLKALSTSITSPANIIKAPFILRSGLREVKTNLPVGTTFRLLNFSRTLSFDDIHTETISGEVAYIPKTGSVWFLDKTVSEKQIQEMF